MLDGQPVSYSVARDFLARLSEVLAELPADAVAQATEILLDARANGRRVYVMGNGGSAATAAHLVCDLVKTAQVPGTQPLRVFGLTDNVPLLTAWSNDRAYEDAFAEQVAALTEPGDVVIAISASGNSPNIVNGLEAATRLGARTIGLLGFDGGAARGLVDLVIHVPCHDYGLVEAAHSAIGHAIPAALRQSLLAEWPVPANGRSRHQPEPQKRARRSAC